MKSIQSKQKLGEVAFWILGILIQQFIFYDLLWRPLSTFVHDSYAWGIPILTFVTRTLWEGELPLWNPYSLGGHPFYPILTQFRLLDPLVAFLLWFPKFFTSETILAIHWNRYLLQLLNALGIYWWLRPFAKNLSTHLCLVSLLLFSPFFWVSFHQDGFLNQFLYFPFLLIVLTQSVQKKSLSWRSTFLLALILGLSMQSYFFSCGMTVLFVGIVLGGFLYPGFRRFLLKGDTVRKGFVLGLLLIGFSLPNLTTMLHHKDFVYPMRSPVHFQGLLGGKEWQDEKRNLSPLLKLEKESMKMDYLTIERSGAFFLYWDLIRAFTAEKNYFYAGNFPVWGQSSEGYLYLGCLAWIMVLLGMSKGQHPQKRFFLWLLGFLLLISLGPRGIVHRVLYEIFPPLWFLRNLHGFILFLYSFFLFFFVLGMDWFVKNASVGFKKISLRAVWLGLAGGIALGLAPAFKPPVHWLASLPIFALLIFVYKKRSIFASNDYGVALVFGHAISVLITLGFNAPFRIPPVLGYWFGWGALVIILVYGFRKFSKPFLLSGALVFLVTGELLVATFTSMWSMPISPLVADLLRKNPSANLSERHLIPPLGLGCNENWRNCFRYVELLNETRYAFTSLEEKSDSPSVGDFLWIRKQTLHPSFFIKKDYAKLLLSDLSNERFREVLAIDRLPFECGAECSVSLKASTLNSLHLEVNSKDSKAVQWAQNFDSDWKASMNGVPLSLKPNEWGLSVIQAPPGKSEIFLRYQPTGFLRSLAIYYGLTLLCLFLAWFKPGFAS